MKKIIHTNVPPPERAEPSSIWMHEMMNMWWEVKKEEWAVATKMIIFVVGIGTLALIGLITIIDFCVPNV